MLSMVGESLMNMSGAAFRCADGSSIAIQTSKGSYSAGERIDGVVVLLNNSPRHVSRVLVRVTVKEHVTWDEEITRTHEPKPAEPDFRTTPTPPEPVKTYEHYTRVGKVRMKRDRAKRATGYFAARSASPGCFLRAAPRTTRIVNRLRSVTPQVGSRPGRCWSCTDFSIGSARHGSLRSAHSLDLR